MNLQIIMPNKWFTNKDAFFNWWIEKVKGDYISHAEYENILDKFNQK